MTINFLEVVSVILFRQIMSILLYAFLTYLGIIQLYIIVRFLSIKFGHKFQPEARKAVLITGGTSGIGFLVAKHLHKLGYTIIVGYFNDREPGYAPLLELSQQPNNALNNGASHQRQRVFLVRMDVRSQESIENSYKEVNTLLDKHCLRLYCLINNAGISSSCPFEWLSPKSIRDVVETNLLGTMMVTRRFIFKIIENKGRIINVSSVINQFPTTKLSVYGTTKCAVAYYSDALHEDIKVYGASCHCVVPGDFTVASNIIFSVWRAIQDSESNLSEAERRLYAKSIEQSKLDCYRFIRMHLEVSGQKKSQVEEIYKISLPNLESVDPEKASWLRRLARWYVGLTSGKSLEESGIIDAYEQAVCLVNPPRRIYAGNRTYTYHMGPFSELLPRSVSTWFGKVVAIALQAE